MHTEHLSRWRHHHVFDPGSGAAERGTRVVAWITAATMVLEVAAGWWFNSMALLADGWHMSSHMLAIGLSALAYSTARRYSNDPRFTFGTWKIEVLAGFASAIVLLGVALMMVLGSLERLLTPQAIHYREAVTVAVLGLVVNALCALILGRARGHDHGHGHEHGHGHGHPHDPAHHPPHAHPHDHGSPHHDLNLQSAYLHVLADAATSVLAIVALLGGWMFGLSWLDPVMGIVGAVLVAVWARGLIGDTGKVLLDREMDHPVVDEIRSAVETGPEGGDTRVTDLHVWRVGRQAYSCALTLVTHDAALTPDRVRQQLAQHPEIVHSTIEIHRCPEHAQAASG